MQKKVYLCGRMKQKALHLIYIICACAMVFVPVSCYDEEELPGPGKPGEMLTTTFIFYIAGENSLYNYMTLDTTEVSRAVSQIPPDARVVLFLDDNRSTTISVATRETPLQCVHTYSEDICSTDSATMLSVLSHIVETYPAHHYSLALNSHASGWVFQYTGVASTQRRSWGIDNGRRATDNYGRRMNIPTLAHVLEQLPHFDFILFDACFMQCIEVAYELRHVTDYVIASPAEIPGHGAPYQSMLPLLCQQPVNDQLIRDLVHTYGDFYETGNGALRYGGVELSAVSTAQLEAFAAASRPLITQLFANRTEQDCSEVQRYCPIRTSSSYAEFFDFGHLIYTLLPSEYPAWHDALEQVLPARHVTKYWLSSFGTFGQNYLHYETIPEETQPYCSALSVFVPFARYYEMGWLSDYQHLEWYHASGLSQTGW